MKVLFVRNEFKATDYLTWLGLFLRFFEGRWYNHLALYLESYGIVMEFVGSGYKQTTWHEWNKANPERKFLMRDYPCRWLEKQIYEMMQKFRWVMGGYEYGIFWKIPANWGVRKITFEKVKLVVYSSVTAFFCSDFIAFWVVADYNPKLFYKLTYFDDKNTDEKIHLSSDYLN